MKKRLIRKIEKVLEKTLYWIVFTFIFICCPLFMIGHYFLIGY